MTWGRCVPPQALTLLLTLTERSYAGAMAHRYGQPPITVTRAGYQAGYQ